MEMEIEKEIVKRQLKLIIMVNSANAYETRRKSIRTSWMNYVRNTNRTIEHETFGDSVEIKFVLGKKEGVDVSEELKAYNDIVFVNVDDSYDNLARKTLEFMKYCVKHYEFDYFMHADDDSFVRVDLLMQLLSNKPKERFYYGYIWNSGLRVTKPLRTPTAKSFMPYEQYPSDEAYPPFACGCGFILSKDLVYYLAERADGYKDYRLVDVAFGMYLEPINKQIIIENDDRIRPYRPLPLFLPDTIVQHYMKPEEFRGYYMKAIGREAHEDSQQAQSFYNLMASMGLMKK